MPVEWRPAASQLHLHNGRLSHVMRVLPSGSLAHLHFGAPLHVGRDYAHFERHAFVGRTNRVTDPVLRELPTTGSGDFRQPALAVELADGSGVLDLVYREHHIRPGKPALDGLPSTYTEDEGRGRDRRGRPRRRSERPRRPRADDDLPRSTDRDAQRAVRERRDRRPDVDDRHERHARPAGCRLVPPPACRRLGPRVPPPRVAAPARPAIDRQPAGASGHQQNPILVLRRAATDETSGDAIGLALVYSGNFLAQAEVDPFGTTRLRLGIDPGTFRWRLEPGESFQSPEAILTWTDEGLGGLSEAFHGLFRSAGIASSRGRSGSLAPAAAWPESDARYSIAIWPDADDELVQVNTQVRGGDDLMQVGLFLDDHVWEAQARGDFQARLFVLEAATG